MQCEESKILADLFMQVPYQDIQEVINERRYALRR